MINNKKMVAALEILSLYIQTTLTRIDSLNYEKTIPANMRKFIASIVYSYGRVDRIDELASIIDMLRKRYGKELDRLTKDVDSRLENKLTPAIPNPSEVQDYLKEILSKSNVEYKEPAVTNPIQFQQSMSAVPGGNSMYPAPVPSAIPPLPTPNPSVAFPPTPGLPNPTPSAAPASMPFPPVPTPAPTPVSSNPAPMPFPPVPTLPTSTPAPVGSDPAPMPFPPAPTLPTPAPVGSDPAPMPFPPAPTPAPMPFPPVPTAPSAPSESSSEPSPFPMPPAPPAIPGGLPTFNDLASPVSMPPFYAPGGYTPSNDDMAARLNNMK